MAYNNNIPQPNDELSVSQPQILANFAEISTAFNLNHVNFNANGEGKHAFVEMPNQSTVPFTPPVTIANEVGLYCNSSTFTNQPELFFIKQNGSTAPAPLNAANGYEVTSSNYINEGGWTRLPSGIMLQWGTFASFSGTATKTLPASASIPFYNVIYQVLVTSQGLTGGIPINCAVTTITQPTNVPTAGGFTIVSNSTSFGVRYLVIGV